jgi:hypothetical protein
MLSENQTIEEAQSRDSYGFEVNYISYRHRCMVVDTKLKTAVLERQGIKGTCFNLIAPMLPMSDEFISTAPSQASFLPRKFRAVLLSQSRRQKAEEEPSCTAHVLRDIYCFHLGVQGKTTGNTIPTVLAAGQERVLAAA